MNKNERVSVGISGLVIAVTLLLYGYTEFFCGGNCYPFVHGRLDPMYTGMLGSVPTLLLFIFFGKKMFVLWVKHIAWWFSILTAFAVSNTSQGGFLPFYSRDDVALFWMAILFIITLIYALIMNRKLKGSS